jgi:hypothetical protein
MNSDEILRVIKNPRRAPYNPAGYSLAPWRAWLTEEESAWINKRYHERWQEDKVVPELMRKS